MTLSDSILVYITYMLSKVKLSSVFSYICLPAACMNGRPARSRKRMDWGNSPPQERIMAQGAAAWVESRFTICSRLLYLGQEIA